MKPRILFVETDTTFLHNLAFRLREHDMHVFEASAVDGVLETIRDHAIGVVLLDLEGLRQQGIELLKEIRSGFPETDVVIIHSPEQVALSIEAMKGGASDDLSIPFALDELLAAIRRGRYRSKNSGLAG